MKFLLDHDVPDRIGGVIRQAGHEVVRLREVLEITAQDPRVLDYAREHGFILVTCNRDDFLVLAAQAAHPGIIILIRRRSRILECRAFLRLIDNAGASGLAGNINFA